MRILWPFRRPVRPAEDRTSAPPDAPDPDRIEREEPAAGDPAQAATLAADEAYFRMLCMAFVTMAG